MSSETQTSESIKNAPDQHAGPGDELDESNDAATAEPGRKVKEAEETALAASPKFGSVDELATLEREIAELHNMEPRSVMTPKPEDESDSVDKKPEVQSKFNNIASTSTAAEVQQTTNPNQTAEHATETLEEEDLIAVLKGVTENEHKDLEPSPKTKAGTHDNAAVGVTIEGEGEFQVIEVIDDDLDEELVAVTGLRDGDSVPVSSATTTKTYSSNTQNKPKELTKEEERNLAMEQMQNLKSARREQNAKNRRKQDIKARPVETSDLLSLLGADWSDDDMAADVQEQLKDVNDAVAAKDKKAVAKDSSKTDERVTEKGKTRNSPPQITSVLLLKGAPMEQQAATLKPEGESGEKGKKNDVEPRATGVPPQTTGFKRTRIIKRKIIWDPDAPETTFSYAQLVRPKNPPPNVAKTKNETQKGTSVKSIPASGKTLMLKTEPVQKKMRPGTPKDRKLAAGSTETKAQRAATPKLPAKATTSGAGSTSAKQGTNSTQGKAATEGTATSLVKRRSQTPVANGAGKKKKVSEVDRLMGDEGAINMLNSLESERQKAAENSDLAKSNMRSRSATISERLIKRDLSPVKRETVAVAKGKRLQRPKASATWDYVYKQQASEDSMIVRRRSNSSYSSSTSLQRVSLDGKPASASKNQVKPPAKATRTSPALKLSNKNVQKASNENSDTSSADIVEKSTNNTSPTGKSFEFAKPEVKSNQKARKTNSPQTMNPLTSDMKKANLAVVVNRRTVRSPATVDEKEKSAAKASTNADKDDASGVVVVKRLGKVAHVLFSTTKAKIDYTFNLELLNHLVETLEKLHADSDCRAVVLTTNAVNFCHGVDFAELAVGTLEKRKKAANQLGTAVKNFIRALATFPKPLIAGVNGSNIGLGVTMLPLFDIVIASDKGTYETPYARIGQVPEGYCIWNSLAKIRGTFKTKLFWLCEKLHSTESALSGLVNKLAPPSKVNEDAIAAARRITMLSAESYRMMKKTSIEANSEIISTVLDQEFETICEQWCSDECFENLKKISQMGHW